MHTLFRAASAIMIVLIAVALVNTPSPHPLPPAPSTPIDYLGKDVYRLDWNTIYPGNAYHSFIVMSPGVVSVRSLDDVLRWVGSMPGGTTLFCSRYQAEIAKPATLRVFGPGQFDYFLRVSRRRGIRVIVDEGISRSAR